MNVLSFLMFTGFVTFVSLRPMGSAQLANWDKAGHLIIYFVFAILAYRVASTPRNYLYLCAGIVVYSGLMEVAQSYMPGRVMSVYDLLANALGVVVAILLVRAVSNTRSL